MTHKSRLKIFTQGASVSMLAQGSNIVLGLASVYIGIRYFGPIVFGIWMLIKSIINFYNTSKFGIDGVTSTLIAQAKDPAEQKTIIFRSCVILLSITAICLFLTLITLLFPNIWTHILGNIPFKYKTETLYATLILIFCQLIRLPTITFAATFSGLQQVYWERFYVVIMPLSLNFLALIFTIYFRGNLITLAILTGAGNIFSSLACTMHLFFANKQLRFSINENLTKEPSLKYIFISGNRFLTVIIASLAITDMNNIIINHFFSPLSVTAYSVSFKLYIVLITALATITTSLWPIYSKAFGEKNWDWINDVYNHSLAILPIIGGGIWIAGIMFSKVIIELWAGPAGYAGLMSIFCFGGYAYLFSLVVINSTLLFSMNTTKLISKVCILEAGLNFSFAIILIQFFNIGGVALGMLLATALSSLWILPIDISRQTNKKVNINCKQIIKQFIFAISPMIIISLIFPHLHQGFLIISLETLLLFCYLIISWFLLPLITRNYLFNTAVKKFSLLRK